VTPRDARRQPSGVRVRQDTPSRLTRSPSRWSTSERRQTGALATRGRRWADTAVAFRVTARLQQLMRRRWLTLLAPLLLCACSTEPPPRVWQKHGAPGFTILIPSDLFGADAQGRDSRIGRFRRTDGTMVVEYDFGFDSQDLEGSWKSRPGFKSAPLDVAGVQASLVEAQADELEGNGGSLRFMTGATFPLEQTHSRALTIVVQHSTSDDRTLALEIIRSVRFVRR